MQHRVSKLIRIIHKSHCQHVSQEMSAGSTVGPKESIWKIVKRKALIQNN